MNLQELQSLIGKSIHSEEMKQFLEQNGFKYPKNDTISNKKTEKSFWIENKKQKVDLLFSIEVYNKDFKPIPAEKKGVFYPILTNVRIYNNSIELPNGLKLRTQTPYEDLENRFGKHTVKSSEVAKIWLNDDGSESWYRWEIDTESSNYITTFDLSLPENEVYDFSLILKQGEVLFYLYDALFNETFADLTKKMTNKETSALMFVRWAIENDLIEPTAATKEMLSGVKNGQNSVLDWVKMLDRGVIFKEDFRAEIRDAIRKYVFNIDVESYYYDDFCKAFLNKKEMEHSFDDKIQEKLNEIATFTEDNYQKVKKLLDGISYLKK